MDTQTVMPAALARATQALGNALADAPPFLAYRQARARLDDDERARALLDHLAEIERETRERQADGSLTREDIDRYRAAQEETASDPSVSDARTAERAAVAYLSQVNRRITELLGVDIAALAGAGGC